jgi:outer membrane receptor protein involved in Fe transport
LPIPARRRNHLRLALCTLPPLLHLQPASAETAVAAVQLETVEISGHYDNSVGSSDAASAGVFNQQLIQDRPLLRPGQVLEYIPGMVVTQHAGGGKANQYFLRGFNLDHGTDFATRVNGMPVNLRTHGHGQGYTDLNFLIPELVATVDYFKGPYYANVGDFGSAGGANIHYTQGLKQGMALATLGDFGYERGLLAGSPRLGDGTLTYGLELLHTDGPWEVPNNFRKANGLLRYFVPVGEGQLGVTAMAYGGTWNSSDQVAQRAIDSGLIGRFGTLDDSTGGESQRYSVSVDYSTPLAGGDFQTTAYWFKYNLNLFSNFTYFLDNPLDGDQFEQADRRNVYGWQGEWNKSSELFGRPTRNTLGFELRQDRIDPVGLYATRRRERLSTTREDAVVEGSAGIYAQNDTRWTDKFRSVLGLRYDWYRFNVDAMSEAENSGVASAGIASPKMSLIFGPWDKTEYFVNAGYGFHSNDARGVTIKIDPATGDPVDSATPLVRSKGAELGLRTEAVQNLQSSLALWYLKLDSELVFVGDAGTTEAGRPSQRYGVEWSNRWRPMPWLFLDFDFAWNHARFTGSAEEGNHVPGAPDVVAQFGVAVQEYGPWSGALFMRYIGSYPLIEDNSFRSDPQTVFDAQLGYRIGDSVRLRLDIFNLFNQKTNDITYYYTSRLPGEPTDGVADKHIHPGESRSFRVSLSYRF